MKGPKRRLDLNNLQVYAWDTASLTPSSLFALEAEVGALFGWADGVPIVTCQRFEVVTTRYFSPAAAHRSYQGAEALLHLARLAAGLESLVLGEGEVLGQVRAALAHSPAELRRLIAPAIGAARALRREVRFVEHSGHTLDLALEQADIESKGSLVVVGGGPMGRCVAERAAELGFEVTLVARRPPPLPPGVIYQPFSAIATLPPCDVLASCLGREAPQMASAELPPVRRLAIDLATPRNLKGNFGVPLLTLANLVEGSSHRDASRRCELEERLRELLTVRLAVGDSDSPLGAVRAEVERIRQRELARSLALHPELPAEKLDTITRSLVNQILHLPSQRLRQSADPKLEAAVAALFGKAEPHDGA